MSFDPFDSPSPPVEVVIGKTIVELAAFIDAGHTIYAHTDKLGTFSFSRLERLVPGRYIYAFDYVRPLSREWISAEGDNHTVESFLASINWNIDIPPRDEIDKEMEELTTQAVWSTVEERLYREEILGE